MQANANRTGSPGIVYSRAGRTCLLAGFRIVLCADEAKIDQDLRPECFCIG
jgi:hypothetical protein